MVLQSSWQITIVIKFVISLPITMVPYDIFFCTNIFIDNTTCLISQWKTQFIYYLIIISHLVICHMDNLVWNYLSNMIDIILNKAFIRLARKNFRREVKKIRRT